MNNDSSSTYFQRIWQKLKRVLSEPRRRTKRSFYISNENETNNLKIPNKKPKLDIMTQSLQDSFDQSAFIEVMKKLLTCSVCLEVRKQANQCQNGHLICINCTLCLQQSTSKEINCPVCRVPLTGYYQRSLLAEQLVSELPTKCRFCSAILSVRQLQQHESEICPARTINCQYTLFGCTWKGVAKQRKFHESLCNVGLSTVALACETVNLNLKNQFSYYEKRNSQWQNTVNKLRERNNGLKIFMKHLVLTKYKDQENVKSSFKSTKLEIYRNQFQIKFNIIKEKNSQSNSMFYKLKYNSKQNLTVNFFLHSIRYDDDTFELDDNLHCHAFSEDEQNAGSYSLHFSKNKFDNINCLENLATKDSLYIEIVLMIEGNESLDNANSNNLQLDTSETISQAISNSRTATSNAGNLVVALISSNSLAAQSNEVHEEETEEDNEEDGEEQEGQDGDETQEEAEDQDDEDQANDDEEYEINEALNDNSTDGNCDEK